MRLIDADTLFDFCSEQKVKETGAYSKGLNRAFDIVRSALHNECATPTVEAAPVVHGKWESFTTSAFIGMDENAEPKWAARRFFVHKKCGRRSVIKEKYCPSCGAKMDGERREEHR